MRTFLRKPVPPEAWEVSVALFLIGWRAWAYPVAGLWRDWCVILCAFWIFTALGSRTRAWPYVAGTAMAGLLVLYGSGQLPLTLGALGLGR